MQICSRGEQQHVYHASITNCISRFRRRHFTIQKYFTLFESRSWVLTGLITFQHGLSYWRISNFRGFRSKSLIIVYSSNKLYKVFQIWKIFTLDIWLPLESVFSIGELSISTPYTDNGVKYNFLCKYTTKKLFVQLLIPSWVV